MRSSPDIADHPQGGVRIAENTPSYPQAMSYPSALPRHAHPCLRHRATFLPPLHPHRWPPFER
ncbi:hypothetical protein DN30_3594 [Vibrio cholerae]|nr:hypothetical protein DN30_3594 [Vibrio cholerae]